MGNLHTLWHDPTVPVVLRSTTTSPFGRKVRMAAEALGLSRRIRREQADTREPGDTLRVQNPLGKMPCLLIGEEAFFDSAVILEMLDALAGGGRLLPRDGLARYRTLTRARLADGIIDATLLMVYEGRFRDPTQVSVRWFEHQHGKVERALAAFEAEPPDPATTDVVSITLAAALGYLDWRRPVEWRPNHAKLGTWLDAFSAAEPAFARTGEAA